MSRRTLVVALALAAASCSGDPKKPAGGADASARFVECKTGDDCAAGDCLENVCVWCDEGSCPAGSFCGRSGKCLSCDGGCVGADAALVLDAGQPCATRAECAGQACRLGTCGPQDPAGACAGSDECLAGAICVAGACKAGCAAKADCAGAGAGPRCDLGSGQCGPCVDNADCDATSENCSAGKCVKATACPGGDRGPCGALACVDGLCRPCVSANDCGAGFDCAAGSCVGRSACTTDDQCKTLSPGHWCEKASGLCKWGCVDGASCGANCCGAKQLCNTTSHACEAKPCNNCDGLCMYPQTCDTTACSCVSSSSTACDAQCGCPSGKTCKCTPFCIPGTCNISGKCQ